MIASRPDFDVAVIGASIAGCTAATLLAREGARVALVERRPDPQAFKRVCGHFIQPSALPVLERLGLLGELESAGGRRGRPELWTPAGWIRDRGTASRALNVRREVLDPLLRERAAGTPGVELLAGATLERLERDGETHRVGLRGAGDLTARLVVGADGRSSQTARLAGLETRTSPNVRFGYWGYFRGPSLPPGIGVRVWFREPDVAIATPTDSGLTMYVAMPHVRSREAFRADPEAALRALFATLPDPPPIADSERVGPMVGKLDLTNESRPVAGRGVALAGDAALAADPVPAIGCGFALQSAEWLADAVAPAIAGEVPLRRALAGYRRTHRRRLGGHARLLADAARRERLAPPQRLLFSAAVHDDRVADRVAALAGREIGPRALPPVLARAGLTVLRRRLAGGLAPTPAGYAGS